MCSGASPAGRGPVGRKLAHRRTRVGAGGRRYSLRGSTTRAALPKSRAEFYARGPGWTRNQLRSRRIAVSCASKTVVALQGLAVPVCPPARDLPEVLGRQAAFVAERGASQGCIALHLSDAGEPVAHIGGEIGVEVSIPEGREPSRNHCCKFGTGHSGSRLAGRRVGCAFLHLAAPGGRGISGNEAAAPDDECLRGLPAMSQVIERRTGNPVCFAKLENRSGSGVHGTSPCQVLARASAVRRRPCATRLGYQNVSAIELAAEKLSGAPHIGHRIARGN